MTKHLNCQLFVCVAGEGRRTARDSGAHDAAGLLHARTLNVLGGSARTRELLRRLALVCPETECSSLGSQTERPSMSISEIRGDSTEIGCVASLESRCGGERERRCVS
jgi:hypothetical protein